MIKSDFSQTVPAQFGRVHFVGVGGAGMSGIAALFVDSGMTVTGSDIRDGAVVSALREKGVTISIGHRAENIGAADTLVVTGAIAEDNPEYLRARELGLPIIHRAQALEWLTRQRRLVAVAGAHGKTTSTAMLVTALLAIGIEPSFVNGGVIRSLGVSAAHGDDDVFVVEADESDGSFLLYDTTVALVTNVDPDHLDHYGSREAFIEAFVSFSSGADELLVISSDDSGAREVLHRVNAQAGSERPRVLTFGTAEEADVRVHSVVAGPVISFALAWEGADYELTLSVAGLHNAINAAGAFAVLAGLGYDPLAVVEGLATFGGAERRFEFRGEVGGVRVFDDFAHHPTEVAAALGGARAVAGTGRVIPIFQPHLFSRTRDMAPAFAETLESLADVTVIVPVYAARELPIEGVSGALIAENFADDASVSYIESWDEAAAHAARLAMPGDIIVPMGGGDIADIIPTLLEALALEHPTP